MLTVSVIFNLVLGVAVVFLWTERDQVPKRDKSGRFKSKAKPKKPIPDFFKDLTGDSQ
jgi:heme/copper-type cytochrome/quinol oxidase subunit 2